MRYFAFAAVAALAVLLSAPQLTRAATETLTLNFDGVINPISGDYVGFAGAQPNLVLATIPAGDSSQTFLVITAALRFGLVGVYTDDGGSQGLTLGVNTADAAALEGLTYGQAFPDAPFTEAELDTDLLTIPSGSNFPNLTKTELAFLYIDTSALDGQGAAIDSTITVNNPFDLVDFSIGTLNGTGTFTISVVPLPSAAWTGLSMLGFLGCVLIVRGRLAGHAA